MKNNDIPQDVQEKLDEYGKKSEDELLRELTGLNINSEEFKSFCEMIEPMLSDDQKKRLEEIKRLVISD